MTNAHTPNNDAEQFIRELSRRWMRGDAERVGASSPTA